MLDQYRLQKDLKDIEQDIETATKNIDYFHYLEGLEERKRQIQEQIAQLLLLDY